MHPQRIMELEGILRFLIFPHKWRIRFSYKWQSATYWELRRFIGNKHYELIWFLCYNTEFKLAYKDVPSTRMIREVQPSIPFVFGSTPGLCKLVLYSSKHSRASIPICLIQLQMTQTVSFNTSRSDQRCHLFLPHISQASEGFRTFQVAMGPPQLFPLQERGNLTKLLGRVSSCTSSSRRFPYIRERLSISTIVPDPTYSKNLSRCT